MRSLWGLICASCTVCAVCGCQNIPTHPLNPNTTYAELLNRDVNVQGILEFAAALSREQYTTSEMAFDVRDGLSLHEAEAVALWYNADLRIARLEAERTGALADTAGLWDDPALELGGGRKWFNDAIDPSWLGSASLSITIPISGRTGAERRARSAEHEAALLAIVESEWRTRIRLRELWLRWSEIEERTHLLDEHLTLIKSFAETAQELVQAGELDPATARLFLIERGRKQAIRDAATFQQARTRAQVMDLLGLLSTTPIQLDPGFPQSTTFPSTAEEFALNHPAFKRLQAEYDAAEARLRLELRKQYPDLTLSPSFAEERDETAVVLGFGFPLPIWNANRQGIANAFAQRETTRMRAESMLQSAASEFVRAEAGLGGARAHRERLIADVAPLVDRQIEESRALLRSGELDMGSLFQALTQAYDVKDELLVVHTEEQLSLVPLSTPIFLQTEQESGSK